jgi:hypothetical protein
MRGRCKDWRNLLCATLIAFTAVTLSGCAGLTSNGSGNPPPAAPTITTQPQNQAVTDGHAATFSVVASGTAPLSYQWKKGGTAISGATSSSYTTPAATMSDSGSSFTATVSNIVGSVTSSAATLTVNPAAPTITTQPRSQTVTAGQTATFSVLASGTAPLSYQWNKGGTNVGTNSSSYTTPATIASDNGSSFTVTVSNSAGNVTSNAAILTVNMGGPLAIATTSCPAGTQGTAYAGCTISATGGSPPYTFSVDTSGNYPPLPEGMSLNASSGLVSSAQVGGQGTYSPEFIVTDSANAQASQQLSFAISGSNLFLANIFPADSIFHHRVDAASTGLPVDTSPAAPIYSGYLSATIKPFFGNTSAAPFPNGIPAIEVPYNQPDVSVATTVYQSYFTSGPIPANAPVEGTSISTGDRHVLVYLEAGGGNNPALYEMWQGIYQGGPWTDSSNALWPNVASNALTPQGTGTSDAAGLPVAPLLVNADEVIGTGTPTSPNGAIRHPIRFTLNHMLNYWVWPATETAGVGSCTAAGGGSIPVGSLISQSSPPASCTMTGPAGEIYRLRASVPTPSCASSSPQAATIIKAFQDYGIILADNGISGGLIGTPDARWNDVDLECLTSLTLADFEPVNVSSIMVSTDSGATSNPGAPTITTQPQNQIVTVGQAAAFSVIATGAAPLGYQWYKNGTPISGATSANYTTPATTASDNGATFTVLVTNAEGSVTSNAAVLTVNPVLVAPTITTQPQNQTVTAGQTASFTVVANGSAPLSYQWYKNGAVIGAATSASYTTPATTASDNGATFTVTVSNAAGNVTSNSATLTVNGVPGAPTITRQPQDVTVIAGQTATFSVVASGTTPLNYQWKKNGANVGTNSSLYTTPATTTSDNGASFAVTISNTAGSVTSNPATLTVSTATSTTSVAVDASANRHPINPHIYGIAYGDGDDMTTLNAPLNRWGGNSTSRYNWQIDAHSAGADWYFETYSDGSGTPSGSADAYVATTRTNSGSEPMFTIPLIDYLANLGADRSTLEGFSIAKYGAQQASDPWNPDAGNGKCAVGGTKYCSGVGANVAGNDPTDTGVSNSVAIQQAWVQHFVNTFGPASTVNGIKYYILDNEPSIWHSTHRDVHPSPSTYSEMYNKIVAYASAIRAADPYAKIVGFEEWSWWAMYFSGFDQANGTGSGSDYATHGNTYYYPWLLQQLYAYKQAHGTSLIDILSVHCYNDGPDGSDDSTAGQQARNAQTRILWDPNFQDPYWYGDIGINGRVLNWIHTLKAMVSQYYPGLEIGCTEYNWGDEANLNGATTQADVLGIYGREGFDLATRWTVAKNTDTSTNPPTITYYPTYLASQIYQNYDSNKSTFGDISVSATVVNPDNLSAFAAQRSADGVLTVMVINKQQASTLVQVSLANFGTTGSAEAWQISSKSQTSISHLADVLVTSNTISATLPPQSITLFVVPEGSIVSPPTAPAGLSPTVGSNTVTLTWNAGGGATSYTVYRGTESGGPYTTIGTVSTTSFTDAGLTTGTTYYYVVSATNSGGSSPNSGEIAATPIVPPTFSSLASASPNPVTQGTSTTVTATVQCTANTLSNGIVQILVLDPNGNTAASQNFTGQNFSTNQTQTYTLTFTPTSSTPWQDGMFTVEVGVFSSTSQQWSWNASAANITARASLTFTSFATATPTSVARGGSTVINLTVKDTGTSGLTSARIAVQVFDSSGSTATGNDWSPLTISPGQTYTESYTWAVPSGQATGTYTVEIGVFSSDASWSTNYYWNGNAATITVK